MEKFKAMSTPKDKAKELVKKYHEQEIDIYIGSGAMDYESAKKCALIACDEILSNNPIALVGNAGKFIYMDDFWQQVKTEIDNL